MTKSKCIRRMPEEPDEVMFVSENEKKVRKPGEAKSAVPTAESRTP